MKTTREERCKLTKAERVTGAKRVDAIFSLGKSFISYPLRVVYLAHEQNFAAKCSILVTVPKKRLKKAVDRNRVKRLIRESYRLNKELVNKIEFNDVHKLDIAFVYVKNGVADYNEINKAMQKALNQIANLIQARDEGEQTT